jgi:paraquat-inducible protein B
MMDGPSGLASVDGPVAGPAPAQRHRLSAVWLIPVAALAFGAWLAWSAIGERGPLVEVSFSSGEGLLAGQTRVRHRAVELGTVTSVRLSDDRRRVTAGIRMRRDAASLLTSSARFWVVRPRLDVTSISGLETVLSGSYIELDPGPPDGPRADAFIGLDEPPAVRTGEPGRFFRLRAASLGAISSGSPVFYRSVLAGEVLGFTLPEDGRGAALVEVFVRAPFDAFVRRGSRFWNASGLRLALGADGVRLEVESLRAVVAGGVAFDTPAEDQPGVEAGTAFDLHPSREEAAAAAYGRRVPLVAYFEAPLRGLAAGSSVELFGLRVGTVTAVTLDPRVHQGESPRVRVAMEIQPERFGGPDAAGVSDEETRDITRRLVALGMRAQPRSANLLTGQLIIALDPVSGAPPGTTRDEADAVVIPSLAAPSLDGVLAGVTTLTDRLAALPFEALMADTRAALQAATSAVDAAGQALQETGRAATPALRDARLALAQAGRVMVSLERGYGADSGTRRDLQQAADQAGEAARAVRLLADFLMRNPEALLRGRPAERAR